MWIITFLAYCIRNFKEMSVELICCLEKQFIAIYDY